MPDTGLLTATRNNKKRLVGFIEQLVSDNRQVWDRIDSNRHHFFNHSDKNPILSPGFDDTIRQAAEKTQSTILHEKWVELKSRMTENHYSVNLEAPKTSGDAAAAEASEMANSWARQIESRLRAPHQSSIADGQIIDVDAIVWWRRMQDLWPSIPEYEYMDEVSDEDTDRFEDNPDKGADRAQKRRDEKDGIDANYDKKFRETEKSRLDRLAHNRARAGSPYQMEIIDRRKFAGHPDDLGGYAFAAVFEQQGFWAYDTELNVGRGGEDQLALIVEQGKKMKALRVYGPDARPKESDNGELKNFTKVHLMTRDSWYELIAEALPGTEERWEAADWELVKSADHNWDRVTMARAAALDFNTGETLDSAMPAFEALFRNKPIYDRDLAITKALGEQYAIREMVYVRGKDAVGEMDARAQLQTLTESDDGIPVLPKGWTPVPIGVEVTTAWMTSLESSLVALQDSVPPTGFAPISETTQPWTAQLNIAQSSTLAKMLAKNGQLALQEGWMSIFRDMALGQKAGGLADDFYAYKVDGEGMVNPKQLVGVNFKDIPTLQVGVDVNATTSTEQITLSEHGLTLLNAGAIHREDYQGNFRHVENAPEYLLDLDASQAFELVKKSLLPTRLAAIYGMQWVVGADLDVFAPDVANGTTRAVDMEKSLGELGITRVQTPGGLGSTPGNLEASTPAGVTAQPTVVG